jgi:hypothetical protein
VRFWKVLLKAYRTVPVRFGKKPRVELFKMAAIKFLPVLTSMKSTANDNIQNNSVREIKVHTLV